MTKAKKIVAAMVAAASVCAMSVTAFAATTYKYPYSFSIEGRDDLYYGLSGSAIKSDWDNPAKVQIEKGNLSLTNRAYLSVTKDFNWPEDYILTEEVMVNSNTPYNDPIKLVYTFNDSRFRNIKVYLLATTGDDTTFSGSWEP